MPVNISNIDQMIYEFVINTIRTENPELDTTDNSPIVDLLVKPLRAITKPIIQHVNSMEFMRNLDNAEYMSEEELDSIGEGNYMLTRNAGSKAIGEVVLGFKSISDTSNLVVPEGVLVTTNDGIGFVTITKHTFAPQELYSYYNPSTFMYEVPVSVEAQDVGVKYNVGEGAITVIRNSFSSNLVSVTNRAPTIGGTDKESNKKYADRIRQFYISRQLGTKPGYKQFILENFSEIKDIYIAGYGDPMMTRDVATMDIGGVQYTGHIGGKIDIYTRGGNIQIQDASVICNSNKLPLSIASDVGIVDTTTIAVYNTKDLVNPLEYTTYQNEITGKIVVAVPELSATATKQWDFGDNIKIDYEYDTETTTDVKTDNFTINKTVLYPNTPLVDILSITNMTQGNKQYELTEQGIYQINYLENTSIYAGTTKEQSQIELVASDMENGDSIELSYSYNSTLNKLDDIFNVEENRIITTDVLFKEATPVYIHIGMRIKLKDGQVADPSKESAIRNALIDYFDNINMGARIEESDIISKLYVNESVAAFLEYVELPMLTFHKTTDSSETYTEGLRDGTFIALNTIEYPTLHSCNIGYID